VAAEEGERRCAHSAATTTPWLSVAADSVLRSGMGAPNARLNGRPPMVVALKSLAVRHVSLAAHGE
jgi:hypothetical protein